MGNVHAKKGVSEDAKKSFPNDLPKFILKEQVAKKGVLKAYMGEYDGTNVLVKVYVAGQDEDLSWVIERLSTLWLRMNPSAYPNLLPYQVWFKSRQPKSSSCFLMRQQLMASLHDRMATRPFLATIEKRFMIYELVRAVEAFHLLGVVHGDIKPENIMVTSWNWLVVTDFNPFKPAFLPLNDPSSFNIFFNATERDICYLAPERFVDKETAQAAAAALYPDDSSGLSSMSTTPPSKSPNTRPTTARLNSGHSFINETDPQLFKTSMDIFSVGCTIGELCIGSAFMSLPLLLRYISSNAPDLEHASAPSKLRSNLLKIRDPGLRAMVKSMTQRDPAKRHDIEWYKEYLRTTPLAKLSQPQGRGGVGLSVATTGAAGKASPPASTSIASLDDAAMSVDSVAGITGTTGPLDMLEQPFTYEVDDSDDQGTLAPDYFLDLYDLMLDVHFSGSTQDERIRLVTQKYGTIIQKIAGDPVCDSEAAAVLATWLDQQDRNKIGKEKVFPHFIGRETGEGTQKAPLTQNSSATNYRKSSSDDSSSIFHQSFLRKAAGNDPARVCKPLSVFGSTHEKALDKITVEFERLTSLVSKSTATDAMQMPPLPPTSGEETTISVSLDASVNDLEEDSVADAAAHLDTALKNRLAAAHQHVDLFEYNLKSGDCPLSSYGRGVTAMLTPSFEGSLLLVQIVVANFRRICHPSSKVAALLLLVRLGYHSTNSDVLRRILPVVVLALHDQLPSVRVMGIRAVRALTSCITSYTAFESNIYSSYLFQELTPLSKDSEITVRVTFAQSIAHFATAAMHCLEMGHLRKQSLSQVAFEMSNHHRSSSAVTTSSIPSSPSSTGPSAAPTTLSGFDNRNSVQRQSARGVHTVQRSPSMTNTEAISRLSLMTLDETMTPDESGLPEVLVSSAYDKRLRELRNVVANWIRNCVLDPAYQEERSPEILASHSSTVKRALLHEMDLLCTFFGIERTVQELLSQLITFLNDSDWELRLAFCTYIPRMCRFVGSDLTCDFIIPCLETALYDVEDTVVVATLHALNELSQDNLLSNEVRFSIAQKVAPLLVHPTSTVRSAAITFVADLCGSMGLADATSLVLPMLQPVLKYDLTGHKAITRDVVAAAVVPAVKEAHFREVVNQKLATIDPVGIHPTPLKSQKKQVTAYGEIDMGDSGAAIIGDVERDLDRDADEHTKMMTFIGDYTMLLAQELSKRTLRWHNEELHRNSQALKRRSVNHRTSTSFTRMSAQDLGLALDVAPTASGMPDMPCVLMYPNFRNSLVRRPEDEVRLSNVRSMDMDLASLKRVHGSVTSVEDIEKLRGTDTAALQSVNLQAGSSSDNPALTEPLGSLAYERGSHKSTKGSDSGTTENSQRTRLSSALLKNKNAFQYSISTMTGAGAFDDTNNEFNVFPSSFKMQLQRKLSALSVPPLPPDLGQLVSADGTKRYSTFLDPSELAAQVSKRRCDWRPREGGLLMRIREHRGCVNRLAVSQDRQFFVSASADKSVKVWLSEGLEDQAFPCSAYTYTGHGAAVTDVCIIENSHTVVSCSSDGGIHVWRVLLQSRAEKENSKRSSVRNDDVGGDTTADGVGAGVRMLGTVLIKKIEEGEGGIVNVQHYHTDVTSVVVYMTTAGYLVGWNLRAQKEAFRHRIRPELGTPTCLCFGPDRDCVLVGTHKGFICLFDLRVQLLVKLWRHSSHCAINRILSCRSSSSRDRVRSSMAGSEATAGGMAGAGTALGTTPPSESISRGASSLGMSDTKSAGFFIFVAAGNGEVGMWALPESSECLRCFRSLSMDRTHSAQANLDFPTLDDVPLPKHPMGAIVSALNTAPASRTPISQACQKMFSEVKALVGFVPMVSNVPGPNAYLITAGTDAHIRYWDMNAIGGCRTVCGPTPNQPRPCYFTPTIETPIVRIRRHPVEDGNTCVRGGFENFKAVVATCGQDQGDDLSDFSRSSSVKSSGQLEREQSVSARRVSFRKLDSDDEEISQSSFDSLTSPSRPLSRFDSTQSIASDVSASHLQGKLFVCHDFPPDPYFQDLSSSAAMPAKTARGAVAVTPTCLDSVLDVKILDLPVSRDSAGFFAPRLLISASRDGTIALWK